MDPNGPKDSKAKEKRPSMLDDFLERLTRPETVERRDDLAKMVGIDGDILEATLLHLAADLLPMSSKAAGKLRGRANYDLCKFACKEGAKIGARHVEMTKTVQAVTGERDQKSTWTASWKGK